MLKIIEVIRRARQGSTKPFVCKASDGNTYFVKGADAGKLSLVNEWVAGRLGQEFGLQIAPFEQALIGEDLIRNSSFDRIEELGSGISFASLEVLGNDLAMANIDNIPETIQIDILAFDLWVKNDDRTLSALGGNPNLLWHPQRSSLTVIDHNLAFDSSFDRDDFFKHHIFRSCKAKLMSDDLVRKDYDKRFLNALSHWNDIVGSLPEEWLWVANGHAANFNFELEFNQLNDLSSTGFWRLT